MRINGPQRLGVIASIIWFLAGGFWGNDIAINDAVHLTGMQLDNCVAEHKRQSGENAPYSLIWEPCWKEFGGNYTRNVQGHWWAAIIVGLVPILLAWLIAWGIIATYRWVKIGFEHELDSK